MPDKRKATCPAPSAVVAACDRHLLALKARSPAAGRAQIIAEGMALVARAAETAPKLVDLCRAKYPRFDRTVSTHIPAPLREQARQLKRARAFGSLQELYLEAVLAVLVDRDVLTAGLDASPGDGEPAGRNAAHQRAA